VKEEKDLWARLRLDIFGERCIASNKLALIFSSTSLLRGVPSGCRYKCIGMFAGSPDRKNRPQGLLQTWKLMLACGIGANVAGWGLTLAVMRMPAGMRGCSS